MCEDNVVATRRDFNSTLSEHVAIGRIQVWSFLRHIRVVLCALLSACLPRGLLASLVRPCRVRRMRYEKKVLRETAVVLT